MKFLRNGQFEVSYKILKWVRDKFEKKKMFSYKLTLTIRLVDHNGKHNIE